MGTADGADSGSSLPQQPIHMESVTVALTLMAFEHRKTSVRRF